MGNQAHHPKRGCGGDSRTRDPRNRLLLPAQLCHHLEFQGLPASSQLMLTKYVK